VLRDHPAPTRVAIAVEPEPKAGLRRELGVRDLAFFGFVCMASPRWIPAAAHAGPASVTVWLIAGLFLGVPLASSVSALMAKYPEAGGLYAWTRNDFGPAHGFISFWLYWIGMAFWFPSAAIFFLSSAAYTLGPSYAYLADSRAFLIGGSLAAIWIALGSNLVGLKTGKWTENGGALAVVALAAILIAAAAIRWGHQGPATPLNFVPKLDWRTAAFWAAIAYGMTGIEVLGMMNAEIRSPQRRVKSAIWVTTSSVAVFYATATLALVVLLPARMISDVRGIAQGGDAVGRVLAAPWISAIIALLVVISGFGAFGGFGTALSRMPFAAGIDHLLPDAFARIHPRWHTPHIAIVTLGIVSSSLLLLSQLGDTMQVAYQELVSLMLIGGFLPYIYMFFSAWKAGRKGAAAAGLAVTLVCLLCSVIPTADVRQVWWYEGKLAAGAAAMVGSGWLLYRKAAL